jgi:hypothetical protein
MVGISAIASHMACGACAGPCMDFIMHAAICQPDVNLFPVAHALVIPDTDEDEDEGDEDVREGEP